MSEEKSEKSKDSETSEEKYPFVDKFDKKQNHPLFRSAAEFDQFVFNKKSPSLNEYPTREQQSNVPESKPA